MQRNASGQNRARIKLGGLWESDTRDGQTVLSGPFGSMSRLVIFRNGYKERDNQPDWILYLEQSGSGQSRPGESSTDNGER